MKKYKVMYSGDPESTTTFSASSPKEAAKTFYFRKKEKKHIFVNSFMSEEIFKWEDFEENESDQNDSIATSENNNEGNENVELPQEVATRPLGISILSVLSIIGGIAILIMQVFAYKHYGSMTEYTGVSGTAMLTNMIILGVWALFAGVGMWTGKKWGWWLGVTYMSYSVLRNANAIWTTSELISQYPEAATEAASQFIKLIGRVIFHTIFTFYYFKNNVLSFFEFSTEKKWKRVLVFLGISVLIFSSLAIMTLIL